MVKAMRVQEKAAGVGFDWKAAEPVLDKIKEEITEFEAEQKRQDITAMEAEFGDVLFSLVNYARWQKIDPEAALERTNKKFISRFQNMEKQAKANGVALSSLDLETLERYWEQAKKG